jgi:hypothetical protein
MPWNYNQAEPKNACTIDQNQYVPPAATQEDFLYEIEAHRG